RTVTVHLTPETERRLTCPASRGRALPWDRSSSSSWNAQAPTATPPQRRVSGRGNVAAQQTYRAASLSLPCDATQGEGRLCRSPVSNPAPRGNSTIVIRLRRSCFHLALASVFGKGILATTSARGAPAPLRYRPADPLPVHH